MHLSNSELAKIAVWEPIREGFGRDTRQTKRRIQEIANQIRVIGETGCEILCDDSDSNFFSLFADTVPEVSTFASACRLADRMPPTGEGLLIYLSACGPVGIVGRSMASSEPGYWSCDGLTIDRLLDPEYPHGALEERTFKAIRAGGYELLSANEVARPLPPEITPPWDRTFDALFANTGSGGNYGAVVDVEAALDDARSLAQRVIERLIAEGIISQTLKADTNQRKPRYCPGSRLAELFRASPVEQARQHRGLGFNGVEICAERLDRFLALPRFREVVCPRCSANCAMEGQIAEGCIMHVWGDYFAQAFDYFIQGTGEPLVECPACGQCSPVLSWHTEPHLGSANLSFVFWNWPPFDSPAWKIDIPKLVAETLHHRTVVTYGRR